jgi:predicted lipase
LRFRRLSGAAYCEHGLQNWTCEFCDQQTLVDVTVFESEKRFVKGFVGYDETRRRAVLSFRGTEPKSFENWLENLDATHAGFPVADFEGKGRVHAGFLDAYVQIRLNLTYAIARLSEKYAGGSSSSSSSSSSNSNSKSNSKSSSKSSATYNKNVPFPIEITGHSLGGALATIAAMDLESGNHVPDRNHIMPRKVDVKSVYTFGSPRVGDGVFAEIYAERLGFKTYRLTHGRDVVPSVPSTLLGFRHVPTEVYEDRNGNITIGDGSGEWKGGEDHVWRRYSVSDHLYYLGEYICGCNS